jgi:hypothetical protein
MSGTANRKGIAEIPPTAAAESVVDLTSDDEDVLQNPLVCVLWVVKVRERHPLSPAKLFTLDLWTKTFAQAVAHLNEKIECLFHAKHIANSTIDYRARPFKVISKAHDLPKGFPKCNDFAECDSEEAYDSFLHLMRLNLAQMKKGHEPVVQIIAIISPEPIAAVEDQSVVILGAADSDNDMENVTRKVFPFRLQADLDRDKIAG